MSISNDIVSTKIYDKHDDFEIVNFPYLDVALSTSYGFYRSQHRASSHFAEFNTRNRLLLLKKAIGISYIINVAKLFLISIADTKI